VQECRSPEFVGALFHCVPSEQNNRKSTKFSVQLACHFASQSVEIVEMLKN